MYKSVAYIQKAKLRPGRGHGETGKDDGEGLHLGVVGEGFQTTATSPGAKFKIISCVTFRVVTYSMFFFISLPVEIEYCWSGTLQTTASPPGPPPL